MDDRRFDDLARTVAGWSSRRQALRALAGGVLAAAGLAGEAAAAGCRNAGDCKPCQVCKRRRGVRQGVCAGGCTGGKVCCDGACKIPGPTTCCTRREHCGPERGCMGCQIETGRCEPEPDGRECGECKRCKDGACTEEDPELSCDGVCCTGDEACTDDGCCPLRRSCGTFLGRECCPEGQRCTRDDGCCPEAKACGSGGGAQAAECCGADETCVGGACCPEERACDGRCCPEDHRCNRRTGRCCRECLDGGACCPPDHACVNPGPEVPNACCDANANKPCGSNGDGTFKACCSNRNEECCEGKCVPIGECDRCQKDSDCLAAIGEVCCGGTCCVQTTCAAGTCCPRGACGVDLPISQRICVAERETCCVHVPAGIVSACPSEHRCCVQPGVEDAGCCPSGRECRFRDGALACCVLFSEPEDCIAPLPGRRS